VLKVYSKNDYVTYRDCVPKDSNDTRSGTRNWLPTRSTNDNAVCITDMPQAAKQTLKPRADRCNYLYFRCIIETLYDMHFSCFANQLRTFWYNNTRHAVTHRVITLFKYIIELNKRTPINDNINNSLQR